MKSSQDEPLTYQNTWIMHGMTPYGTMSRIHHSQTAEENWESG
jgi:hypothetical protein